MAVGDGSSCSPGTVEMEHCEATPSQSKTPLRLALGLACDLEKGEANRASTGRALVVALLLVKGAECEPGWSDLGGLGPFLRALLLTAGEIRMADGVFPTAPVLLGQALERMEKMEAADREAGEEPRGPEPAAAPTASACAFGHPKEAVSAAPLSPSSEAVRAAIVQGRQDLLADAHVCLTAPA